ncbi:FliC/FljB family flagellin [Providencia stuartii]|uniref:Flagellin n=1 Tax=Providencia stuartii ATCC 25827 TaxID=471874 RepID=A0AA86YYP4_PROST|nr:MULTISPECIES: FliC/FljB family flagellin [Providencia]EDU58887.1 bacterial flagellin domain protein [Providencia stuartii ATCC 25827]MBS7782127.1 FliC/FljB family flagellin [Providencia thailandensis]MDK7736554.1 FliC/FljB family flagellin [Providencia stuartii]MTC82033.1 FliC/FljB family flagellin [Providencia stuartii]MTC94172.1 FliC/FljB family flagellin [Providencia stuartii]
MAQVINTNILSLTTQNNLNRSQSVLGTAIERLSSGSRINSAKDDAAGQAIANRFTANIKGLTQASRNASDGISMAQVAEGAVNEINENLQRIRELTVQAANGSNSDSDITSIRDEVQQRLDEIDRIYQHTEFNGTQILNGDTVSYQVGAKDGQTISMEMQKMDLDTLGIKDFKDKVEKVSAAAAGPKEPAGKGTAISVDADNYAVASAGGAKIGTAEIYADKADATKFYIKDTTDNKWYEATKDTTTTSGKTEYVKGAEITGLGGGTAAKSDALDTLDTALKNVDSYRSKLGAFQNRMQSTINNLNNSVNNLSAARSRIQDADFATEVSNMSRGQILQQAGTSVLAQANQVPQGVLSLLR